MISTLINTKVKATISAVQLGANSLSINRLIEEDTSFYITEEDSTQQIISED